MGRELGALFGQMEEDRIITYKERKRKLFIKLIIIQEHIRHERGRKKMNHLKKVITEEQKDRKFKEELKVVEDSIQVKPSEYYEYNCSKCGKLVKVKKP